jgi:hypothetical protein
MNIGKITLQDNAKNLYVYDVIFIIHDITDTVYGFPGGGAITAEQSIAMRQALSAAKGYTTTNVQRTETHRNVSRSSIRNLLLNKTGSTQEAALQRLESLWLHGVSELVTEFQY